MKDIRLIATDIDGTLLDDRGSIPSLNRQMLREAESKGIRIALCSGRGRSAMTFIRDELDLPVIFSCFNGSYVEIDGIAVEKHTLDRERLNTVYEVLNSYNVSKVLFSRDLWYMEEKGFYYGMMVHHSRQEGIVAPFPQLFRQLEEEGTAVYKILGHTLNTKLISKLEDEFKRLAIPGISVVLSDPRCLEVMVEGADKVNTLYAAERVLGIKKESIVAFGDYDNDLNMIKEAGFGVAMENASDNVKKAADYITLDNKNSGLGVCLERLLHHQEDTEHQSGHDCN